MSYNKDSERTLRLRENKRRNRARQKDYTADLERKLREFEQEGVRATIEVQNAAKKVAEENTYLRELLLALGLNRPTINDWITRRRCSTDTKDLGRRPCHERAIRDNNCGKTGEFDTTNAPLPQRRCSLPCEMNRRRDSSLQSDPIIKATDQSSATVRDSPVPDKSLSLRKGSPSSGNIQENSSHERGLRPKESSNSEKESSQPPPAPCRLLTRFASNPGSDVSQILAASESEPKQDGAEGALPCESAYKLLMRYATSDEKLEALARTLEEGCVPNSGGGCKVKNETVSEALLDICL